MGSAIIDGRVVDWSSATITIAGLEFRGFASLSYEGGPGEYSFHFREGHSKYGARRLRRLRAREARRRG